MLEHLCLLDRFRSMLRTILTIAAILGIIIGVTAVVVSRKSLPTPPIVSPPPHSPYAHAIAAAGIVEAASQDISIGTPFTQIIEKVYVKAGDYVEKNTPLFKLDTLTLEAKHTTAIAKLAVKQANYQKNLALPRPEQIPIKEASVKEKEANYKDFISRFDLVEKMSNPNAISRDEYNKRQYQADIAKNQLERAKAELDLLLAGAWIKDLDVLESEIEVAKSEVAQIQTEIERSMIRAPLNGVVMRVNIRPGELAPARDLSTPLMLFGALTPLHIRVDINEAEVWRVLEGAEGTAFVRGNSSLSVDLNYMRLEPYLIPKPFLTGNARERVDTRVLQLIYEFDPGDLPIWPGQIMDVFIEAKPNL